MAKNGTPIAQSTLDFGLVVDDVREAVWRGDAAIDWEGTPEPDREKWAREGARPGLLRVREGKTPTRLTYRPLTAIERARIEDRTCSLMPGVDAKAEPIVRVRMTEFYVLATAVALDLPDLPDTWQVQDREGKVVREARKHVDDDGLTRLSNAVLGHLQEAPGFGGAFFVFFGARILAGSRATREDFFPSSPASTGARSRGGKKPRASSATAAPKASRPASSAETAASATLPPNAGG